MAETRKLAAILAADVAGYSRLAAADEERTLARLRALRSDLIDPTIALHHGRVVKRTGDGSIVEFRSVVDAVRCAIEVQTGMVERNAGLPPDRRIEFRVGIHLGDVVEESDGDLMGDGVNIAARLEGVADPGGICLSEDAYRQVRDRVKEEFTDVGEKELKNIARPVRVYAVKIGAAGQATAPHAPALEKAAPPRLSIVVLPFANLGGDPEQEYFVDGVTESLTTDLSRISGSFVIARNTAFTYKGKPFDVKQIGRELNVRYVLEGSVQRSGNRLRVAVQLIDAETGAHLWAERFDKPVADLFDMQDEIVARLANTLGYEFVRAEAKKSARSGNLDAIDLIMRGWAAIWQPPTKESTASARDYFERALRIDPQNAEAMVGFAYARFRARAYGWTTASEDTYATLLDLLTKATAINPGYAFAYYVKSNLLIFTKRHSEAIEAAQTAVALDPNAAYGYSAMARAEVWLGRCEQSNGHIKQAFALSPRDPIGGLWHVILGISEACLGRLDVAIMEFKRAIDAGYRTYFIWRPLRRRRVTTPRQNLLWRRHVASILNSQSNRLRRTRACRKEFLLRAGARPDCPRNEALGTFRRSNRRAMPSPPSGRAYQILP
jgi:TolB-like protein/class 3 adenylate cyclase